MVGQQGYGILKEEQLGAIFILLLSNNLDWGSIVLCMLSLNTGLEALCRNSCQSHNQGFEQPLRCSDMQTVQICTKVTCMEYASW